MTKGDIVGTSYSITLGNLFLEVQIAENLLDKATVKMSLKNNYKISSSWITVGLATRPPSWTSILLDIEPQKSLPLLGFQGEQRCLQNS